MPKRKLRFAEYLYYSKIIDWHTLIKALVWQFQSRPRVGEIAFELDYIEKDSIIEILKNTKLNEKFCEVSLRLDKMTGYQINVILGKQKRYDFPIGKYFY